MRFHLAGKLGTFVFALVGAFLALPVVAAAEDQVIIDASQTSGPVQPLPFAVGGRSPDGHTFSANQRYLLFDGKPWFPVMGEFQFARYSEDAWEEEILKMKAGGINIVSTYVFWIYHEEVEGQFDWSGRRDLRRFLALCAKHDMYVWLRVGPWAHGEVRNGGLPDWLLHRTVTRQSDPVYLCYVRRFYGEIGEQVRSLFWKDGGPIIGVQLENEYNLRGPGKGAEHMLLLLKLAHDAGLDAPFYSATGWDDADVPAEQFLPVYSGYADGFWKRSVREAPPSPDYFFTSIRGDENVGDDLRSKRPDIDARFASFPFLTAEMGSGMEQSYHRRPLMSADDTAAMVLVKLGSGVTMYGYYMFQGGTNPEGKLTTLQESQATGYPNDVPVKSYDFQAPLGEFGQMHPSFRELKEFNLFLNDFGSLLAPMPAYFPKKMPASLRDVSTPRVSARVERDRGFISINNYQRNYPMPAHKDFQVRLKTATRELAVPRHPIDIPSGVFMIWPVNLDLSGSTLEYATAQPMCRLQQPDLYVFFAWPGVPPEFALVAKDGETVEAPGARISREDGRIFIDQIRMGTDAAIRIRKQNGAETRILVVSRELAGNLWKGQLDGQERLIDSSADVYFEPNQLHLVASDTAELNFGIYPIPAHTPGGFSSAGTVGLFARYSAQVVPLDVAAKVEKIKDAKPRGPVVMGREVATAPKESEFENAAQWSIEVPAVASPAVRNVILRITYQGDIARVYDHGKLLDDDFYKGTPWEIGLNSVTPHDRDPILQLSILPLPRNAPIYLPPGARPRFPPSGEIASLDDVRVVPEYEVVANLNP
jgi:beta-galactosidase